MASATIARVMPNIGNFIGILYRQRIPLRSLVSSSTQFQNTVETNKYKAGPGNISSHESKIAESSASTNNTQTADESSSSKNGVSNELEEAQKSFLEQKLKLEEDLKAIDDKYKRALAETENVRRRMMKQVEDMKLFGIQSFCKDLLEVADILHKAVESVPRDKLDAKSNPGLVDLYEGLKMTEGQLRKVFQKNGVEEFSPGGEKFDPNQHEAMFEQVFEGRPGGEVGVVIKTGYKLHGRVVRPATVGVSKDAAAS